MADEPFRPRQWSWETERSELALQCLRYLGQQAARSPCRADFLQTVTHGTPRPSRFWDNKRRLVERDSEASQAEELASRARREEEACRRRLTEAERVRVAAEQEVQRQQHHRRGLRAVESTAAQEMRVLQAAEVLLGLRDMKGEDVQVSRYVTPVKSLTCITVT